MIKKTRSRKNKFYLSHKDLVMLKPNHNYKSRQIQLVLDKQYQ